MLVDAAGLPRVEHRAHTPKAGPLRVALAPFAVDESDVFLFHKTTARGVYERALAAVPDVHEVLLWNRREELTEATTANLVVELDGQRVTPPIDSGLLAITGGGLLLLTALAIRRVLDA